MSASFPALDEATFDAAVLARPGVSVVDFWSVSCVPCRQMTRVLQELAREVPASVLIAQVDTDAYPGLAERFGVRALPTLLFFKDGRLAETRTGIDRRQVLKKAIVALVAPDGGAAAASES
ncbi:MAG: thioredoxin family protein [Burkholderiales bacterium]|nr:thioredoxin family protein [Burkholderiales bacterium]